MSRGFSLIELIIALFLLEVGILATAGLFLLSQQNYRRAEVTLRGVLEARWVADSLAPSGVQNSGQLLHSWGEIQWAPENAPVRGLRISVWSPVVGDTVVTVFSVMASGSHGLPWPDPMGIVEDR